MKRRKFWGWGHEDEGAAPEHVAFAKAGLEAMLEVQLSRAEPPTEEQVAIRDARVSPPASLAHLFDLSKNARLVHALGRSFLDVSRALRGRFAWPPDLVATPRTTEDVARLLDFAGDQAIAVVPFGGGTSVHGGVEPRDLETPSMSLDLRGLAGVVEVDERSLLARVRAGTLGPDLERELKERGLSLRHFPQSFEMSTLGGWIATRAGGHFATGPTHIDDLVAGMEVLTPRGRIETRTLPGSGAGPDPNRSFIGSEGTLGVITEATMRIFRRPTARFSATVRFATMSAGLEALRAIVQAGFQPTNARLVDELEAMLSGAGGPDACLLLLAYESVEQDLLPSLAAVTEIARAHGGEIPDGLRSSLKDVSGRSASADTYKAAFFRAPYLRDELALMGVFAETYETAAPWSRIEELDARIREGVSALGIGKHVLARRITHAYRDGCAPYYTVLCKNADDPERLWFDLKSVITDAMLAAGGTVTHHHAVGRDLTSAWRREVPELHREALRAMKTALDPRGLMNPGVLFDVDVRR